MPVNYVNDPAQQHKNIELDKFSVHTHQQRN